MKKERLTLFVAICLLLTEISVFSESINELKIDPLLLVSLKECRNITNTLGDQLYPGWDFQKTPILFYKPKVQELLINYPGKPEGFSEYSGFNPLGGEPIFVRNDTTFISYDDQNTTFEIGGISVLVVADPDSRMRNQLKGTFLDQPMNSIIDWLEQWNFVQSPYEEIKLILHEAFHVYQAKMAPEKSANEVVVSKYPLLDPVNNALYVLEGNILRDALFSRDRKARLDKLKEFVAVRTFRQSRLEKDFAEYENLNEYVEGTAKYVEYKFLKIGERIEPIIEMYYHNGFNGYRGILAKQYESRIKDMVNIVAVNDNRFGNKFGSGPLRFKLYELGACQALLLDDLMPEWKDKIFKENVYLSDLLKQSVALSNSDVEKYLKQAKTEYNYEQAYQDKLKFAEEGNKIVQEKLNSILETPHTLVTISYQGFVEKLRMSYTPFGVTQVSKESAIYDMVPIKILFKEGVELVFKKIIPVFVDKGKKEISFAIDTPATNFRTGSVNQLNTDEFSISTVEMRVEMKNNHIVIRF